MRKDLPRQDRPKSWPCRLAPVHVHRRHGLRAHTSTMDLSSSSSISEGWNAAGRRGDSRLVQYRDGVRRARTHRTSVCCCCCCCCCCWWWCLVQPSRFGPGWRWRWCWRWRWRWRWSSLLLAPSTGYLRSSARITRCICTLLPSSVPACSVRAAARRGRGHASWYSGRLRG